VSPSPWDVYVIGMVSVIGLMALIELGIEFVRLGVRGASGESLD
jgi:hypothetical protein